MNCQKPSSNRSKMSLSLSRSALGTGHSFCEPDHFLQWLQGEEETSADVCVRGVPARGGTGSQEVTDFVFKELRMAKLPGRWQKRDLRYLKNRCGHRFSKEEVVCEAQEEYYHEEWEGESCSESLVASHSCKGMGSPAQWMMSSPASSRRAIKGGLRREETHFSGNSPLGQIFSLQPTNHHHHHHHLQQPKQSSPLLSYFEKEAIRTRG